MHVCNVFWLYSRSITLSSPFHSSLSPPSSPLLPSYLFGHGGGWPGGFSLDYRKWATYHDENLFLHQCINWLETRVGFWSPFPFTMACWHSPVQVCAGHHNCCEFKSACQWTTALWTLFPLPLWCSLISEWAVEMVRVELSCLLQPLISTLASDESLHNEMHDETLQKDASLARANSSTVCINIHV